MNELIEASKKGNLEDRKALVAEGADIHAEDDAVLRWAAENGCLDFVTSLFAEGADTPAEEDDSTLCWAAKNGYLNCVIDLVAEGAESPAYNDRALRLAAENGHDDVVNFLKG